MLGRAPDVDGYRGRDLLAFWALLTQAKRIISAHSNIPGTFIVTIQVIAHIYRGVAQ
jgi:hypothetical protein